MAKDDELEKQILKLKTILNRCYDESDEKSWYGVGKYEDIQDHLSIVTDFLDAHGWDLDQILQKAKEAGEKEHNGYRSINIENNPDLKL
jgi:hypothetical protein